MYCDGGGQVLGHYQESSGIATKAYSFIQHIGFLSIALSTDGYFLEAVSGLQQILRTVLDERRVKKVELFTSNIFTAKICQQAGFFVRGEKIAARFEEGEYKNEVGLEYSFFNIIDAKKLILTQLNNK